MTEPAATTDGTLLGDNPEPQDTADPPTDPPKGEPEPPKDEPQDDEPKGAPEEYEAFTLTEGVTLDESLQGEFVPLAKELNLSQEQAQKMVDLYAAKVLPQIQQKQAEAWEGVKTGWETSAKADPEYGGDKFPENFEHAKRAMDQFATPELRKAMNEFGFGNHPEIIRLMVRVGKAMAEDSTLGNASPPGQQKDTASKLYGTT